MHATLGGQNLGPKPINLTAYFRKIERDMTQRAKAQAVADEKIGFSFSDGCRWYAVMTNIRCEERAKMGLLAKGFRAFLPETRKWVKHARVRKALNRPLLSRYLFVETDANLRGFMDIRLTDGVESILCNGDVPAAMPSGLVDEFMLRQLRGDFDDVAKEALPIGARIRIMEGEYHDFFATVVSMGGRKGGGEVLAQLINTRIRTRFALMNVRPA